MRTKQLANKQKKPKQTGKQVQSINQEEKMEKWRNGERAKERKERRKGTVLHHKLFVVSRVQK